MWNLRKAAYRRNLASARCPCQHPSDSGRPLETHCDAALDWNRPGRFRLVCPALRTTAHGYCCSLPARDVRPFWGRAALLAVLTLFAAYTTVTVAAFLVIRLHGNRTAGWLDLALPTRWARLPGTNSRQFLARAIEAIERRDFDLARLSLQSALAADPANYDAALLHAMLDSLSANPNVADIAFQWLLQRHPEQSPRTALIFHDLLLAKGRPEHLARFALWMAAQDAANAPLWIRTLVVALRLESTAGAFAATHAAALRQLPPPARALVASEVLLQDGRAGLARAGLQQPVDPFAQPAYAMLQLEQLVRCGDLPDAMAVKTAFHPTLGEFRSFALQYWLEKQAGNDSLALACFARCASGPLDPGRLDLLASVVIRAPDRAALALLDRAARHQPFDPIVAGSLWITAVLCDAPDLVAHWADRLRRDAKWEPPPLHRISFDSLALRDRASVPALLERLPLPRETIYALFARITLPRPGAAPAPWRAGQN